jgi:hypothetical protein
VVLYALAKLFEFYDHEIFTAGQILSGHTLKHFAAAAACFAILKLLQNRRPIGSQGEAIGAGEAPMPRP